MARWLLCLVGVLVLQLGVLATVPHTALAAPRAALSTQNAIQIENQNPGDPSWDDFSASLDPTVLSGYGSKISLNHGGSIDFYVTTTASSVQIDIFRLGWYGGAGARHMLLLGTFPGQAQPIPNPDRVTGMVACNWQKTATLNVPSAWTTGVYLAKLTASSGNKSFIVFIVRNDGGHEDFELQASATTYQAYNTYGGTSLYNNNTNGSVFSGPHATKVSFDRPFNPGDSNGAGQLLFFEYPFIRWAESQGFDLTYVTDVDTHEGTNPLTNHKAFISVGHDEYWSKAMRDNLQAAINAGVNVAFFGGNEMYWQIRFEPSAAGVADRVEVGYKDYATDTTPPGPDPQWNVNNAIVTTTWADPVVNLPESLITGLAYGDQLTTASAAYVVQNASSWVYANTGFKNGDSVPGIVAYEYDSVVTDGTAPAGLTVLAKSPVTGFNTGAGFQNSSIYTASSGALVFNAGDIAWSWGLDNWGLRNTADQRIQQTTLNIMYKFNGGTPPPPPPPPPPGTYFTDGFESGTFSAWTSATGTGTISVESSIASSGAFAAQITNGSGQSGSMRANLVGGAETLTYTRFYFRVASPGSATTTLAQGLDGTGHPLWSVIYDAGRKGIDAFVWNGTRATRYDLYSNMNIVAPDAWYGLEVEANQTATGHAQIWLNGATIAQVDGDLSGGAGTAGIALWNEQAGTVYFDDVITSDKYNGPVGGSYPGPNASVSPSSLTFAGQNVGTTSPAQTVTLTNTGTAPLSVSGISISGTNAAEFGQSTTCGSSVAVGASCTVSVTFSPAKSNTRTATLTVADSAPSGTQSVALSGSGIVPPPPADGIYFHDGFESGNLAAWGAAAGTGAATVETTTVNSGSDAVALTNGAGQYESLPASLLGGGETLTYTRFYFRVPAPASSTTTIAQGRDDNGALLWTIIYDAGRHGLDVYIWNGARTRYDLYSNTNIVAPDLWYGLEIEMNEATSGHAQVWLNGGTIGTVDGDLSVAAGMGVSQVSLWNEVAGTIYFDDAITSNKYNGPVGGSYPGPLATVTPGSVSFANQNVGTTSPAQTVTLTNTGTAPLTVTAVTVGGANAGDFSVNSTCPLSPSTLGVNASCTVSVTFSPSASGSRTATLTFTDNDPSGTQSVALSGSGVVPPPPADGVYFHDDFESGNLAAWGAAAGTGAASAETTVVHSGSDAVALTNGSGQYESLPAALIGGAETLTYTSVAFRIAGPAANTTTLIQGRDPSNALMWTIIYDAGRHGLDVYVWNGARTRFDLYSNANIIAADTWYTLELEMNETASGHAEIWLNGASILAVDGDLSVASGGGVASVILWNEAAGTIYYDDVKVANLP
ncbi:MAG TPA: N,N-dimethylformamidase beta subunit family domain-containing protein [Ktedonobacterales bacterium]|nr:N,N-dimethylformamidase beta subunit family domain-containing protein [Ktedonobacterales bacterium]